MTGCVHKYHRVDYFIAGTGGCSKHSLHQRPFKQAWCVSPAASGLGGESLNYFDPGLKARWVYRVSTPLLHTTFVQLRATIINLREEGDRACVFIPQSLGRDTTTDQASLPMFPTGWNKCAWPIRPLFFSRR